MGVVAPLSGVVGAGLPLLVGLASGAADVLFLLATDLGVSAVLVSHYPVVVVLLARVVRRERLTTVQFASAGLALTASVLLASA